MQDGFTGKVLDVLSDPMNLPPEFLDYMVQHQAVNGLSVSPQDRSTTIAHSPPVTTGLTTTGTTFGTGVDLLSTPLSFTASGGNSYLIHVVGPGIIQSTATQATLLNANLDGADAGRIGGFQPLVAGGVIPLTVVGVITPASGNHTINVRMFVSGASTGTVQAGAGGVGNLAPLLVSLSVI